MTVFHTGSDGIPEETIWYAVYIRGWSEKQADEDEASLGSQRRDCMEMGELIPGGKLFKGYQDVLSGDDDLRPDLAEMIEDAKNEKFTVLIVSSMDRLIRAGYVDFRVLELVQKHYVRLVAVSEDDGIVLLVNHAAILTR